MAPSDMADQAHSRVDDGRHPTDDERMLMLERVVNVIATHQSHLVNQISESVVISRQLTEKQAELTGRLASIEERLPGMIAAGFVAAVGNPATWSAGRDAMRREARDAAGGWMLGAFKFLADKLLWAGVLLGAAYTLGGWPALLAMFKSKVAE